MSYSCKILLDSISETGKRITTMEITFPRCVLAEAETHRVLRGFGGNIEELIINNLGINVDENLSRNSASSRAIPINKMIQRVKDNPFIPEKWGKPVSGMGAKEYWPLASSEHDALTSMWKVALDNQLKLVQWNMQIGNKEDLNRLLEPFMYHTAIITATEYDNFFKLRTNPAADWKIRKIADLMYEAYHAFDDLFCDAPTEIYGGGKIDLEKRIIDGAEWSAIRPQKVKVGEWHCPLVYEEDGELVSQYLYPKEKELGHLSNTELGNYVQEIKKKISVARCARVSYLTHDGKRDIEKDLELFERLRTSGHWSPFEHCATPYFYDYGEPFKGSFDQEETHIKKFHGERYMNLRSGNFIGWKQFRKEFVDENCTNFKKEEN